MKADFTVETAKIVGAPVADCWSQTHSFFPEDSQKKEKRGGLLAAFVIRGLNPGIEAIAIGREVLSRIHEEYYGNLEGGAFEKLGEAVKKVCQEQENLEIIAASLLKDVLYLVIFGEGRVILKRGDRLGAILDNETGLKTASGLVEDGDTLVLGSKKFFEVIGTVKLQDSLGSGPVGEAVELLAPAVLGQSDMADAAAVFAFLRKEEQEEIAKVESENLSEENVGEPQKIGAIEEKIVVKRETGRSKKIYFFASLVLLVLLLAGTFFGMQRKRAKDREQKIKSLVAQSQDKLNQGKTIFATQPNEGRSLAAEAQRLAKDALTISPKSKEAEETGRQIDEFLSASVQEIEIEPPAVFMDLGLINDGGSGISLSFFEKDLVILDAGKKKIYLLDFEKKSHRTFDFSLEGSQEITAFDSKIVVFSKAGIEGIDTKTQKSALIIGKDEGWQEVVDFSSFNNNLYLLDRKAGNIWRYLAGDGGFGARKSWFVGSPPDLSKAVSFAVDGSVWVLQKDGISKFTIGKTDTFSLSKMPASPPAPPRGESQGGPEPFSEPAKIFTSSECENLYVLDKGMGKIFVIGKNGEFKVAYAWGGLKEVRDIVAVEQSKRIFLLSGDKIYEIGMK